MQTWERSSCSARRFAREAAVQSTGNLTEVYNKQILKSFENELKLRIEAILKEYKISPEKIEISMNVNEDRSIDISNITIVFKEIYRNKCDKAISKINEMFSVVTKITFV